jgi:hypothetical protein
MLHLHSAPSIFGRLMKVPTTSTLAVSLRLLQENRPSYYVFINHSKIADSWKPVSETSTHLLTSLFFRCNGDNKIYYPSIKVPTYLRNFIHGVLIAFIFFPMAGLFLLISAIDTMIMDFSSSILFIGFNQLI